MLETWVLIITLISGTSPGMHTQTVGPFTLMELCIQAKVSHTNAINELQKRDPERKPRAVMTCVQLSEPKP